MYSDRQAWANSVDPDETPQNEASHLGLHCLLFIQQILDTTSGSKLYFCSNKYGKEVTEYRVNTETNIKLMFTSLLYNNKTPSRWSLDNTLKTISKFYYCPLDILLKDVFRLAFYSTSQKDDYIILTPLNPTFI